MKIISPTVLAALLLTLAFGATRVFAAPVTVPGTADPWLAGMPDGATASNGDVAPAQSPVLVTGLTLIPGRPLLFRVIGGVHYAPGTLSPPDGSTLVTGHLAGDQNGIANVEAPADALMGVFLGPDQPNLSPVPASLNFNSAASRDYSILSPLLKQVFFIGDGLTGAGVRQRVVVPPGATRLFLGPMDGSGWYNNVGSFSVRVIPLSAIGATEVDITYTNVATQTGPTSFGLPSLPESVPAWFVLRGVPTGPMTFSRSDVLFAELTLGDGTWTEDELVSFSMTIDFNIIAILIGLQYEFAPLTTPSVTDGRVLNNSFQLHVSGTDIGSGLDFEYLHQDSMQELTLLALPGLVIGTAALVPGGIALSGTGGTSNGLFRVLSSPDVTIPVTNWPAISTNTFNGNGTFSLTNPVAPGDTQQFYRLFEP